MEEVRCEIKRSKLFMVFFWFLIMIGEAVFGGTSIFGIISIVREDYKKFDDPISQFFGYIIVLVFCLIIFCLLLLVAIYLTVESAKQVDIYTESKMYHKVGDKIKFEIEYANVKTVCRSYFNSIVIMCYEPFKDKNALKGQSTYIEYYRRDDVAKIVQLITDYQESQYHNIV